MSDHDHDGDAGLGMDSLQMMGITNAMKTGDVRIDMFVAMCIPVVLRFVFGMLGRLDQIINIKAWKDWWGRRENEYRRCITHRSSRNWWGTTNLDEDTKNTVLIKAIQLYLHHHCDLRLNAANLDLTSMEDKQSGGYGGYYYHQDDDDEGGSRKTLAGMLSKYKVVKKPPKNQWHSVGSFGSPPAPVKLTIEEVEENSDKEGSSGRCTLTYQFLSTGENAIDTFIDTAYSWYMKELRKMEDNSRYYYDLKSAGTDSVGDDDGSGGGGSLYTRYRLSDEKTFESLFFEQKNSLLKMIQHFEKKSGKYAIKGYPHKLGVLLHGPPGTGKTSLIKALAQHTGRSIVNVSLPKISTNSQLQSVFFDKKYHIQGEDVPVKLGFKDVIYVMEDVDAASKVVKRRDGGIGIAEDTEAQNVPVDLPQPKSVWRMLLESNDDDCKELVEELMEKSQRLKKEATSPEMLAALSSRMTALPGLGLVGEEGEAVATIGTDALESADSLMNAYSTVDRFMGTHAKSIKRLLDSGASVDETFVERMLGVPESGISLASSSVAIHQKGGERDNMNEANEAASPNDELLAMAALMEHEAVTVENKATDAKTDAVAGPSPFFRPAKDQLNLTGLLNVLDGVVDTPGRIVVMTTNHPEMLDPALIRPGRIDKQILLGHMAAPDVVAMMEHYFQTSLDEGQRQRVERAIEGCPKKGIPRLRLTPAQVEQLTAEDEEVEGMIAVLEKKSRGMAYR